MTREFAKVVDELFLHVLGLLERIERNDRVEPDQERALLYERVNTSEQLLNQERDPIKRKSLAEAWEPAKYGLVCWIDEMLINAPWDGAGWWSSSNKTLEWAFFGKNDRYCGFYERAKSTQASDALEVYYIAVVLGFRGMYDNSEEGRSHVGRLGLPPTLKEWARQIEKRIREGQCSTLDVTRKVEPPAEPLDAYVWAGISSVIAAVLATMTIATAAYHFFLAN